MTVCHRLSALSMPDVLFPENLAYRDWLPSVCNRGHDEIDHFFVVAGHPAIQVNGLKIPFREA